MRRSDDGSVELDLGRLGAISEGIVVTYHRDGEVVGRSVPRRRSGGDASLEARVLEARNTIFSQELWHELTREARTLAAYDVRLDGARLTCKTDRASAITVELLPLASCPAAAADGLPDNGTAEAVSTSLHVLLSYAHRYNELVRTRPMPPHVPRSRGPQMYALLRPVIARFTSRRSVGACTRLVGGLARALRSAGFAQSAFTLRTPRARPAAAPGAAGAPNQPSAAQALVRSMLQLPEFAVDLDVLPGASVGVRARTLLFPVVATFYHVVVPRHSGLVAPSPDGYADLAALSDYLDTAVAHALAGHFLAGLGGDRWARGVVGTSLRCAAAETLDLHFSVERHAHAAALVLTSSVVADYTSRRRRWQWTASPDADAGAGASEPRPLAEVVAEVVATASS